jgi:molybdate transport system regulatory protein
MKVWIVFDDEVKLGDGRARLLELVDRLGSLRRAVERVGMSYRNGWGYFRELERASGIRFLEAAPGGRRGGTRLTAEGRAFLARYRRFRDGLATATDRQFRRAFGRR